MIIQDLALEALEEALNRVLAMDPDARRRLADLHGRVVRVDLQGTGIQLNFVPGHDGHLRLLGSIEHEPDCTLSGSPVDLIRAGDSTSGHAQLFAGRVQIDGDTGLAHGFSETLAGIDIDWEEQLSRLTGDIAAHEIGRGLRAAAREGRRLGRSAQDNLSEYLTEEARLLPHRFEVEDFLSDVDELRDTADRLEARIALLERRRGGEGR